MENELSEYADGIKGPVRLHAINSALVEFQTPDLHCYPKLHKCAFPVPAPIFPAG